MQIQHDPTVHEIYDIKNTSEELEGGMTNAVYRVTDEDVLDAWGVEGESAILKEYDDKPTLSLAVTHYRKLHDNFSAVQRIPEEGYDALCDIDASIFDYIDRAKRMDNEQTAVEELEDQDIDIPAIVYRDDENTAFEDITDVEPLPEYVENIDVGEVYEAAREIGEVTAAMHEEDIVKMDNRMENILVTEDGEFASIDWEYTITDADAWDKSADLITFVSSAKLLERETYKAVRNGFSEGYAEEEEVLEGIERGFAVLTSTAHPAAEAIEDNAWDEFWGAWKNAVVNNIYDGVASMRT